MELRQIKEFFKIDGTFRSPGSGENGKLLSWNDALGLFAYLVDNVLATAVRETATNRVEFTLTDGTKVYLSLGELAWLDSVTSAVTSVFGRAGVVVAAEGDYLAAQVTNAFDKNANTLDNIIAGTTNKHFTAANSTNLGLNTTARHSHSNKSILDLITNAGSGLIVTDAERILWNSYTATNAEFIQDTVAAFIQNGTGITWVYDDIAGTLTPTIDFSLFTTDNLAEGTTNKYYSGNNLFVYTITLPSATTVAGRMAGATFPAGWTIQDESAVNLLITHTLTGRKIAFVNVWEIDGSNERLSIPFQTAYAGILGSGLTVLIEGLNSILLQLRIELIFN